MTASDSVSCHMTLDFSDESEISQWRTVLDGVMGGRSSGARFAEDNHMVFRGVINTNGGGFSSIRRSMSAGDMSGAESLRLKLRQDERDYRLTFRTSERFRGRSVSYQLVIPSNGSGEWENVDIPLTKFRTSIFGRSVPAAPFDASDVWEMGIILADGVDGEFRLEIAQVDCQ